MGKIGNFFDGIGGNARANLNETLMQEWTGLEARWQIAKLASPPPTGETVAVIEALLEASTSTRRSNAEGWRDLNRAEQLVAPHLTGSQLNVEFASLLDLARTRKLTSLAVHEASSALFPASAIEERRDAYLALLHDLQSGFVYGRFLRRLNRDSGMRLFIYGSCIVALAAFTLGWLGSECTMLRRSTLYSLALVAAFGCAGAYFSRVMIFQADAKAQTMSYESYLSTYVDRMLRLRLLYGIIGAVLFYFILQSGTIDGSVFPEMSKLGGDGKKVLVFDANLAALLVWSFIAGFSERLVPDTLTRTEGKAADGK